MPEQIGDAFVAVHADTTGFVSGMKGAAGAVAGIFGAIKVGQFLGDSLAQAKEAQKVGAQTAAVLKSTGGAANITAGQINDLANNLSQMAGIDDEVIQAGENMLLTFRNVRNEAGKGNDIFNQATKASLDLSVALGRDLTGTTIMLGKALQDPIAGLTALRRVGVGFTESQKEMIKTLVGSGDVLGAQKVILREVTKEFGGSAAAQVTAADKAKVAIQNLKESIGVALMPAVKLAAQAITALADGFNSLPAPLRSVITVATLVGGSLLAISLLADKLGGAMTIMSTGITTARTALAGFNTAAFLAGVGSAALATGGLALAGLAVYALTSALSSGKNKLEEFSAAAKKWATDTATSAKASGHQYDKVKQTLEALKTRQKELAASHSELNGAATRTEAIYGNYGKTLQKAAEEYVRNKDRIAELDPIVKQLGDTQKQAAAEQKAATSGVDAYIQALKGGASATEALVKAQQAGQTALANYQNALQAAAGGALSYEQAQQAITQAQNDYNQAVLEFGPNSAEAIAAATNLKNAQLNGAAAAAEADQKQQDLVNTLVNDKGAYARILGYLQEEIGLHPTNAAGIQLEIDKLNEAKLAADALAQKTYILKVEADTAAVYTKLNQLKIDIGSLPGVGAALYFNPPPRQSGGPVMAGRSYLVGEKGPELLTLGASGGYVTPNARTGRAGGGLTVQGDLVVQDTSVLADLDYWAMSRAAAGGI